ncbi:MAG: histidine kinase [Flavobacteriaceae bacterium]|nr:histidine kinase [Flavobacteriaceae bacterium]
MNNYKETLYWSVQIVYWSFLNVFVFIDYWPNGNQYNQTFWQTLINLTIYSLIGIFCSHQIKKHLNKNLFLDKIKLLPVLKAIGITFFYIVLFYNLALHHRIVTQPAIHSLFEVDIPNTIGKIPERIFFNHNMNIFLVWIPFFILLKGIIVLNRNNQERLLLKVNLKESQLNTLKGQINPHFMFNSLNNIRGLILEDAHKSREMITRLSDMLRYSLTKNDFDAIALQDELEMVDNYVAISKIQMEDRLQFNKSILVNTAGIKIPPMIIQMLVENAAKHGIANLKKGGIITLNIKQVGKKLLIEVCNSGKLSINTESTQLGIKNIKERLSLLYKGAASFNLEENNDQVVATIQIPLS